MTYMIKAAAAVLVLLLIRTVNGEYKRFTERKTALCEGFVRLLEFIRTELSCRGRAVAQWAEEIDEPALAEVGFTDELKRTQSLHAAFCASEKRMPMLGVQSKRVLDGYFAAFGRSYRTEEEERARRTGEELTRILERERADAQKSVRAVRTLSYAMALGIIILIL